MSDASFVPPEPSPPIPPVPLAPVERGFVPGWYRDPTSTGTLRFWDGIGWTEATAPTADAGPRMSRARRWPPILVAVGIAVVAGMLAAVPAGFSALARDLDVATFAGDAPEDVLETMVFTGSGRAEQPAIVVAMAVVTFDCPGCTGSTVLQTDGAESLLVNVEGAYHGSRLINVWEGPGITRFTVRATGDWTITVEDALIARDVYGDASGRGDSVIYMWDEFGSAELVSEGEGEFIVGVYGDLLWDESVIEESGEYRGVRDISGPAWIEIRSDGEWSISPRIP